MAEVLRVPLKDLNNVRFARAICYPKPEPSELNARLNELERLSVEALEFSGRTKIDGTPVLGKGTVGIIVAAITHNGVLALKIRRTDARRQDMAHEAEMLEKANAVGVGPKLYGSTKNMISMQFVRGSPLALWVERRKRTKSQVRRVLTEALSQAYKLDEIGLDHGELSRAPKNIIIGRGDKPWIVDFESASVNRRAKNVSSILQYFLFGGISRNVRWSLRNRRVILEAIRAYKSGPSMERWVAIKKTLV